MDNNDFSSKVQQLSAIIHEPDWKWLVDEYDIGVYSAWLIYNDMVMPTDKVYVWIDDAYEAYTNAAGVDI